MPQTIIEKIFAAHASRKEVTPGEIVDIYIDTRVARSYEGAGIISQLRANNLSVDDPEKTVFTFDCSPSMHEQRYLQNIKTCRDYADKNNILCTDASEGIGTQVLLEKHIATPGSTYICSNRNAIILGAIGAFGQGMSEKDVAAVIAKGKLWFKVPRTVRINIQGVLPDDLEVKDMGLNLIKLFGPSKLMGAAVELYGEAIEQLSLDERIILAGMAAETGALTYLIPPNEEILQLFDDTERAYKDIHADEKAVYAEKYSLKAAEFAKLAIIPGSPPEATPIHQLRDKKITSAYIGGFSHGRMHDLRLAASLLNGRQISPGIFLKIIPSSRAVFEKAKAEGIIDVLRNAGAVISENICADFLTSRLTAETRDQVIISTGIRYVLPELSSSERYIASTHVVISSAIAGFVAAPDDIQAAESAAFIDVQGFTSIKKPNLPSFKIKKPTTLEGKVWVFQQENISADAIIDPQLIVEEEGTIPRRFIFQKLNGYQDFGRMVKEGDILMAGKNFGRGSQAQKAVVSLKSIGIALILAESFGHSFEREAINGALPIMTYHSIENLDIKEGDMIKANLETGEVFNLTRKKTMMAERCSDIQLSIYQSGGLLSQV